MASHQYLEPGTFKYIYLYHHRTAAKQLWGLFIPGTKRAAVYVVDTVRSNQLPSLPSLYNAERSAFMAKPDRTATVVPDADHTFEAGLKKISPVGFFGFFCFFLGFLGFLGFWGFFFYIFAQKREFSGFFQFQEYF